MSLALEKLRDRIARTAVNRRGYRQYSGRLRKSIMRHVAVALAAGESYAAIASELGVPSGTLLNWSKKVPVSSRAREQTTGFRPVEVQEEVVEGFEEDWQETIQECSSEPVVVFPCGVRVEGLAMTELPGFLERMGCR